ncbi:response regulator transcription factor [Microbacterium sp. KRD172]|uniref:response regulator transcription factor n=1 Tax=Microbacterium sp. KRD172 TaxID=2729727 RepID=UPI0019CF69CB|nr:response regulator transcription factor [Microbacterium sp. KRD172]
MMDDASSCKKVAVVIDDDLGTRALVTGILERAGFAVHCAGTGAAGAELTRSHGAAITTLDVDLPDVDGFETATRIRASSDTYLLMLTARDTHADIVRGYQSGADGYMVKPVRPLELRARIEAMLRRPRTP